MCRHDISPRSRRWRMRETQHRHVFCGVSKNEHQLPLPCGDWFFEAHVPESCDLLYFHGRWIIRISCQNRATISASRLMRFRGCRPAAAGSTNVSSQAVVLRTLASQLRKRANRIDSFVSQLVFDPQFEVQLCFNNKCGVRLCLCASQGTVLLGLFA